MPRPSCIGHLAEQLPAGGVGKGTRIGIMYGYGPDWVIAWLGVTRIGAICLPFSTSYKPPELRKALRQGDVDTLLIPSSLLGQDHEAFVEGGARARRFDSWTVPYSRPPVFANDSGERRYASGVGPAHRSASEDRRRLKAATL